MDKYLTRRGLITPERTARIRLEAKNQVRDGLKNAIGELLPEVDNLFEDVYEKMPLHL
jgi:TPP-dependent pyruvate/acetoin dehydrogenase alpha subunit